MQERTGGTAQEEGGWDSDGKSTSGAQIERNAKWGEVSCILGYSGYPDVKILTTTSYPQIRRLSIERKMGKSAKNDENNSKNHHKLKIIF